MQFITVVAHSTAVPLASVVTAAMAVMAALPASMPHSVPLQPWARGALAELDEVRKVVASAETMRRALQAAGMPSRDDPAFLTWLQGVDEPTEQSYRQLLRTEKRIRENVIELWGKMGDPSPIVSVKPSDLLERSDDILSQYEALARTHGHESQSSFLRDSVPKLIKAVDSPYAIPAIKIFQAVVKVDREVRVSHWRDAIDLRLINGDQLSKDLSKWLNENGDNWTWNEASCQFVPPRPFTMPDVKIARGSERRSEKGNGDAQN